MAELGRDLLAGNFQSKGLDLRDYYFRLLKELGLLTRRNHIRCVELMRLVVNTFPDDYLKRSGCSSNNVWPDNWLVTLLHKPRGIHSPLKHLLLLCALDGSVAELFKPSHGSDKSKEPNGPCQNPACRQRNVALAVRVGVEFSPDLKANVELFRCDSCQCTWAMCESSKDKVWIKDYGPAWRQKLKTYWDNPKHSLRRIAQLLEVDPMTVKRHARSKDREKAITRLFVF